MSTSEIVWEDPPTTARRPGRWKEYAEQLRAQPGRWARVDSAPHGSVRQILLGHGCEVRVSGGVLYARWPETG